MNIFKRFKAKPSYYYAKVDENKRCVSVWRFSYAIDRTDAVEISSMDYYLIGQKWNGSFWSRDDESEHGPTDKVKPCDRQLHAA